MPRASSNNRKRWSSPPLRVGFIAAGLALAVVLSPIAPPASTSSSGPHLRNGFALRHTELSQSAARQVAASGWVGRTYSTAQGENVTVYVAEGYLEGDAAGQRWADFFGSLLHGGELSLFTAYITTPDGVREMCRNPYALGCYGSSTLVMPGEVSSGIAPELIARHEYGHHVAANRVNPPWIAIDWGTKRWASAVNVCSRARTGTAFPGDEDEHYEQNPGEGFAEAYRILNETKAGIATSIWDIVDRVFYPDQAALTAIERDVLEPYSTGVTRTQQLRFGQTGKPSRTLQVATPLDGDLAITVSFTPGTLFDVDLLGPDGKTVVARGLWSGSAQKRITYGVCGERSLLLRVVRRGLAGRVAVMTTTP